ncbi:MAG: ABC transporter permease [Proteobacteria bacterium]|nr:ABC transporter permease [Pseudomonadota bacterium]
MTTLGLAVRNLLRNRRRSLATLLALAIGSTAILLFAGFSANIKLTMETTHVRTGGHLQIQHRDLRTYGSGDPTSYGIAEAPSIIEAIARDETLRDLVLVATPMLQFGGIAGNYSAGVSQTILGIGLVAADQSKMREWNAYNIPILATPLGLTGTPADSAVIGTGLARILQLCEPLNIAGCSRPEAKKAQESGVRIPDDIAGLSAQETVSQAGESGAGDARGGSQIEILVSNARGAPNVASLNVVHTDTQPIKALDDVYVALHLPQAQRLIYGAASPKVTAIALQLRRSDQMSAAIARLNVKLSDWAAGQPLLVLDFATLNPFYVQTIRLFDTIFAFILALIGGIVLFTVNNTMNTAVVERTVEIGTLRAIGLRRGGIRGLFVAEAMLLGLAGGVFGIASALIAAFVVNHLGLEWLPPGNAGAMPLVLRVWGEWTTIVWTTAGLVVIALLSAWWPAYRAARLNVVDALRHV